MLNMDICNIQLILLSSTELKLLRILILQLPPICKSGQIWVPLHDEKGLSYGNAMNFFVYTSLDQKKKKTWTVSTVHTLNTASIFLIHVCLITNCYTHHIQYCWKMDMNF